MKIDVHKIQYMRGIWERLEITHWVKIALGASLVDNFASVKHCDFGFLWLVIGA